MKVWLEILQRLPTLAFFWISTNVPIFVSSPISQPYRLMNFANLTFRPSFTSGAVQTCAFSGVVSMRPSRRFQHPATMPGLVLLDFVVKRRPRSDERHVASQHVPELWQLVEAGLPENPSD